jgi:para-aminobenzoate synthetase/4-amino-4-deoxychorismate lyase
MAKEHAERARRTQSLLGREWIEGAFENALAALRLENSDEVFARVRVLLEPDGEVSASWTSLDSASWGKNALRVFVSSKRVNSWNPLLRIKTTSRKLYDQELKAAHSLGFDECLFLNQNGELTEGSISNLLLRDSSGRLLTPAADCGLLEGLWRQSAGAEEARLNLDDLRAAQELWLGNSVRGAGRVAEVWRRLDDGALERIFG